MDVGESKDLSKDFFQNASTSRSSNRYKQQYRKAWETLPEFKDWLKASPGSVDRGYCTVCEKSLHAHRLSLLKHTCSVRHMKAMQKKFKTTNLQNLEIIQGNLTLQKDNNIQVLENAFVNDNVKNEIEVTINTIDEIKNDSFPGNISSDYICNYTQTLTKQKDYKEVEIMPDLVTTHVLDTSKGMPVSTLRVSLYRLINGRWTMISEKHTDSSGRCGGFVDENNYTIGRYKIHFDVDQYFKNNNQETLYPFVEIIFDVKSSTAHHHIPLILSPFGYSTYFGTP